jgi:hypothetical protein
MSSSTYGVGPASCENEPTFDDCASCFVARDEKGYTAYAFHFVVNCGCETGGTGGTGSASGGAGGIGTGGAGGATGNAPAPCLAECDTSDTATDVCNDSGGVNLEALNRPCNTCLEGIMRGDPCFKAFGMECATDRACADFSAELQTCPPP